MERPLKVKARGPFLSLLEALLDTTVGASCLPHFQPAAQSGDLNLGPFHGDRWQSHSSFVFSPDTLHSLTQEGDDATAGTF